MLQELQMRDAQQTTLAISYCWFLRAMGAICLVSAIIYWTQLLGISGDGQWRFDIVVPRWRIVLTILAIILPAAGLGLWLTQAWGVVLWVVALGIEVSIYGIWSELYLERPNLVSWHIVSFLVYIVLASAYFVQKHRAAAAR